MQMGDADNAMEEVTPLLIEVQERLEGDVSLSALARRYGYSPFHFHRFFSRTVGETPKRHVDRLRLERAAYKLAITEETVLGVGLSVGFQNHETFSRAFKRAFGCAPREYRRLCTEAQLKWAKTKRGFRGKACLLSEVRFVTLPPMRLLAVRCHGTYADLPVPFTKGDGLWNGLVDFAAKKNVEHELVALLICYDDPTMTPMGMQRCDACIAIKGDVPGDRRIRRLDFEGGAYGGIEHAGPLETIEQAYWMCADGIRRSKRYRFEEGPPVQIYRRIQVGGDASANLTEVYFPVRTKR